MKICYLSGANSPHTKKWCAYFSSIGYEVHLISFDPGYIEGVTVHHIDVGVLAQDKIYKKVKYFLSIFRIKTIIKKINPDILHAHRATSYALIASTINVKPYFLSVWGLDVFKLPNNLLFKKIIIYNLNKADYVLSTSKFMKNKVISLVDREVIVTPFGVDTNIYKPDNSKIKKSNIIIGTVKTLRHEYGIDLLIKSFKELTFKYSNIELHIAGKGELQNELEKLCSDLGISNQVKFLGYLEEKEVIKAFNHMDIAVFPSRNFESFGVAAVEAQACGIPVVVSNIEGLMEATLPNESSMVFEENDYRDLSKVISYLIDNPKERIRLGKNGRKYVLENYDLNSNFSKVNELYLRSVKKQR